MKTKIKPCPFCGSIDVVLNENYGSGYAIGCRRIGCACIITGSNKRRVIKNWNRLSI